MGPEKEVDGAMGCLGLRLVGKKRGRSWGRWPPRNGPSSSAEDEAHREM